MKITLINCYFQDQFLNLGIGYLAASISRRHSIQLVDLVAIKPQNYFRYIEENLAEKPDIVGFSVSSFSFQDALYIGEVIKQRYPGVTIIFGGTHATLMPEETLTHPVVDAICIGEGERSFNEYLDCVEDCREPTVDGIWYKNADGKMVKNKLRPFEKDLDSISFPNWDYWDIESYLKKSAYAIGSLPIITSRGCPYSCTYCSAQAIRNAVTGKYYRTRSPQNVIKEIKMNMKKYWDRGFRALYICDDMFGLNNKFLREFCDLYIEEGLNKILPWGCQTRCDIITEKWAREVKNAGCFLLSFGVESGDDYIRNKIYKKNIKKNRIMEAVRHLKNNGIDYTTNFIIGCPDETKESIKNSMRLLKEIDPPTAILNCYVPLPMTELGERARKKGGIKIEDKRFTRYWNNPTLKPDNLTINQINIARLKFRTILLHQILKKGFRERGLGFLMDIFNYIFSLGTNTLDWLKPRHIYRYLQNKAFAKYIVKEQDGSRSYEKHVPKMP